ncbi:uncharacterized protein LOC133799655 [Humulus lupulus]|uniref:uncharacterized protein LOC133799655 n=1 Tax=Humulus lupulus TaxID=3486 RepID=UPI002B41824D|nr:uncharacterized protein LOC133799655 [Humulus lupulus]
MDSDLENLLNKLVASRVNKQNQASQKGGHSSKLTKKPNRSQLTSKPSDLGQVTDPTAFLSLIQHNFILKCKVTTSKVHAQEARNAQLKAEDDLKKARLELEVAQREMEARDEEIKKVQELDIKLEATWKEVETRDSEIKRVQELNAKLEEDKKMNFKFIKSEKARLLEKLKTKIDCTVDMAMYRIWANNPDLDTSFLSDRETEFITRWKARLEEEESKLDAEEAAEATEQAGTAVDGVIDP